METHVIVKLMENSGLVVTGLSDSVVRFKDPTCIFDTFNTFLNYAWYVVVALTAIMLMGWAALYIIKGVKLESVFHNAKTLILIFSILSLTKPIVNVVYGDNLFAKECPEKEVSLQQVKNLLEERNKQNGNPDGYMLSETFNIIDSGVFVSEELLKQVQESMN